MDELAVRETLKAERLAALTRVRALHDERDGIVADSVNANADDEHDPEGPTIAYERAQITALIVGAQSTVDDLDQALARLSAGSYSVCEVCGMQISPERLAARPAGRTCIGCAHVAGVHRASPATPVGRLAQISRK